MSVVACSRCGQILDSDIDPQCFVRKNSEEYACLCHFCRKGDDYTEDHRLDDPRHEPA